MEENPFQHCSEHVFSDAQNRHIQTDKYFRHGNVYTALDVMISPHVFVLVGIEFDELRCRFVEAPFPSVYL